MTTQVFADGFGPMVVSGQVVRIDLVTLLPNQRDAQGRMGSAVQGQLIMPLEGFLRAAASMQQGIQEMVKAGLIKVTPANGADGQPTAAAPGTPTPPMQRG